MTTTTAEKVSVAPFGVEADHPRNADLLLQSIPGCKLRGAVSASKGVTDPRTGETSIPLDQARHLGMLPPIPGMQIHVNPAKLSYVVVDPLYENEELCERIRRGLENDGRRLGGKIRGVPPKSGKLDVHRMKTLCRELYRLLELGHVKMVKGTKPTMEQIDRLPGDYLLNPGARVANTQPQFEKDWDQWVANLSRQGG